MIKGLKSLETKLTNIINNFERAASKGVENALNNTRNEAIMAKDKVIRYPEEILDSDIKVEINGLTGRCYTDGERVLFVEYGTGTYAEMEHIGTTKTFLASNYTMWLLAVNKAPAQFNNTRIVIGDIEYYVMLPTQAHHFFSSTGFAMRDKNVKQVNKDITDMIKEQLK